MSIKWQRTPLAHAGVICACDSAQEWLLAWWWERYSAHNLFPVTFVDLGMSEEAQRWCQKRGEVVALDCDAVFVSPKEKLSVDTIRAWEEIYGPALWTVRNSWFKKPFALLHSPYKNSLWLDLDCEVLGPLDALFNSCDPLRQIALVSERRAPGCYNGGVIAFTHGAAIIERWAEEAVQRNHCFWSDDALLSAVLQERQVPILPLTELYNWRLSWGVNIDAYIHHWVGTAGKAYIKHYGGLAPQLQGLFRRSS